LNFRLSTYARTQLEYPLGYLPKTYILIKDTTLPAEIMLTCDFQQLEEVKIIAPQREEIILGNPISLIGNGLRTYLNTKYGLYVPNTKKISGTIQELTFNVRNSGSGIESPFIVNVYSKSANSIYPGKALIEEDMIVYNPQKKRRFSVDIKRYHIKVPEQGFFIVAEILSKEYYSSNVLFLQGQYWNKLPSFFVSMKKVNNESYSVSYGRNWHTFEQFNFSFTAKVLKD